MATLGLSKVFILDKYFTELQKFWETEKKLQDASSSNEAVHLQQRLKSLSSELVTLRNRLHTGAGQTTPATAGGPNGAVSVGNAVITSATTPNTNNPQTLGGHGTTTTANTTAGTGAGLQSTTVGANGINILSHLNSTSNGNGASCNNNTTNGKNPMLVTPSQCIPPNSSTLNHQANILPIVSPRNTSIPYPLPHHNSTGAILIGDTAQCGGGIGTNAGITGGGTLPRRTTVGYTSKHQTALGGTGAGLGGGAHLISPGGVSSGPGGGTIIGGTLKQHFTHGGGRPSGVNEVGGGTGGNGTGTKTVKLDDLIHLPGPLTEDAVMRTLQTRFNEGKFFTNVGPILLSVNPYHDVGNPLTLSSTRSVPLAPQLRKIVQEAVRQQAETGYPQAIILSGTSGSGKTHCSMLLLRQLFAVAGGGPETDAFKHLAAAFTVLRSLGSAKTSTNSESSRIGQFIEVQVTDGALYRTKIHCYFLDQTRVIRPLPNEKNYHIFYQMLAGLNAEECARLNLEGYSPANLRYLQNGDIRQDEHEDAARFQAWKACLGILGIPFLDVVRVLAAVLLLGNVQFVDGQGLEVEVSGETELNAVANLLGVPPAQLFRGLTIRTHNARGQLIKSVCDANMSNMTRDSLAKALYCRTVATIVRRANSLKRLGSTLGTLSSDSNESVHNQAEVASQHASTIGGNAGSKSMAALNNAVRHATDGFIGILDMFGFEEPRPAQLEHLCINLCAETMQHFYNTHIFKSSVESCREEGIICDTEVDYVDNVPCIDLISSLRTGLLSMLDAECSVRGTAETYVAKIKVQHRNSARLEQRASEPYDPRMFAIRHFAGRVEYDTTNFLDTNRDVVPDDLVSVFYKHTCNFGFATHLFGTELKALYAQENVPRGLSFRIAPTSHTDLLNGDEPVSTLTQDFHTRLDNLLRTLVHARPHFVRCIRSNTAEKAGIFDRGTVVRQIRALQVLETVNLMASGFPHRMRFKQFTARYRMLAPFRLLRRCEEKALEDCKLILDFALENPPELDGSVTLSWAPGKRHVFLSEGIRQHLENLRTEVRMKSATLIQATWRGWNLRKRLGTIRRSHEVKLVGNGLLTLNKSTAARPSNTGPTTKTNNTGTATRPRPQPIAGTPPPDPNEKCDSKIIAQTCTLFGLDLERPPPVPPSRSYTVTGNSKLGYPQTRIMKMNFPEDSVAQSVGEQLRKGEAVTVTGASHRRGHLIVEHNGISLHVPFQYMELVKTTTSPPPPTGASVNI
ncbi:myosin-I heavy chain isoform X2 [Armigeres subalbatus]|uniref:myosin-I heavy chain isoform X2 n=1 Tax=Armigeres subalbatus TaxID=124917 RepID=UPI002ED44589